MCIYNIHIIHTYYKLISLLNSSVTVYLMQKNIVIFIKQRQRIEDNSQLQKKKKKKRTKSDQF